MSCSMFSQRSCKNLTDLIVCCCSSMVKFRTDTEVVQEIFLLATIQTEMGIIWSVLRRIDPVLYVATGRVCVIAFIQ